MRDSHLSLTLDEDQVPSDASRQNTGKAFANASSRMSGRSGDRTSSSEPRRRGGEAVGRLPSALHRPFGATM